MAENVLLIKERTKKQTFLKNKCRWYYLRKHVIPLKCWWYYLRKHVIRLKSQRFKSFFYSQRKKVKIKKKLSMYISNKFKLEKISSARYLLRLARLKIISPIVMSLSYRKACYSRNNLLISNHSVIYFWYNEKTGKGYVGSAKRYKRRVFEHLSQPRVSSQWLQKSIAKHGKSAFKLFILFNFGYEVFDKKIRFAQEQAFLDMIPHGLLYNLSFNAEGGMDGTHVWVAEKGLTHKLARSLGEAAFIAGCDPKTVKSHLNKGTTFKNNANQVYFFYEPKEENTLIKGIILVSFSSASDGLTTELAYNLAEAASIAGCTEPTAKSHLNKGTVFKNRYTRKLFSFSNFENGLSLKEISFMKSVSKKPSSPRGCSEPTEAKLIREKLKKDARDQKVSYWVWETGFPAIFAKTQSAASIIACCSRVTVFKHCASGTPYTNILGKTFNFASKDSLKSEDK